MLDRRLIALAATTAFVGAALPTGAAAADARVGGQPLLRACKVDERSDRVLNQVAAVAPDDVWAVGFDLNFTSFTMHWDGSSWTQVGDSEPNTQLERVDADQADNVWTTGFSGSNGVVECWDGQTWARTDEPFGVSDVAVLSPDDAWLAGGKAGRAAMWHWDGQDLVRVDVPAPQKSRFNALTAVSATGIWAVGSKYLGCCEVRPLIEHWAGRRWHLRPAPDPMHDTEVRDVSAVSANEAYAVGLVKQFRFVVEVICAAAPNSTEVPTWLHTRWRPRSLTRNRVIPPPVTQVIPLCEATSSW